MDGKTDKVSYRADYQRSANNKEVRNRKIFDNYKSGTIIYLDI